MGRRATVVEVGGRSVRLSNLGKALYPSGFTKGAVIDYYSRIAPILLGHIRARPLTRKRYPNGVEGSSFFEKNAPSHTPGWVRTVTLASPGSRRASRQVTYVVCDELPVLVWVANLAALELHVPQWTLGPRDQTRGANRLVFDLDPGPPATLDECRVVAGLLRQEIERDGLTGYPKTSGKKGMQVYAPVAETDPDRCSAYAKDLADRLAGQHPDLVVSTMAKVLRGGKVFIDWSQNNAAKTTVAPYSLRAQPTPTVSAPLTWDEVTGPGDPRFTAEEVLDRAERHGDLFAGLLEPGPQLPG